MSTQFTTLRTADILDDLCLAVDVARATVGDNAAWMGAIDRAWNYILTTDALNYDPATHALQVASATSEATYTANGECQCKAFTHGKGICWHRAAARIVRRALELRHDAEIAALADELIAEAVEAGDVWYTRDIAIAGARSRMPGLVAFQREWDAEAYAGAALATLERAARLSALAA